MRVFSVQLIVAVASIVTAPAGIAGSASEMQHARRFAMGGTGYGGGMSVGERALRAVLAGPDAAQRLERMWPSASDAGRLYILLGLRARDRAAYQRVLALSPQRNPEVETMNGCIVGHESFRRLVRQIDRGGFDDLLKRRW